MAIRPLYDRVLVKRQEEETTSAGGIIIPDSATEKPAQGAIVAVGTGKPLDNGDVRALTVKVGDVVLFDDGYSVKKVKVDGEELLILREEDIQAIVE